LRAWGRGGSASLGPALPIPARHRRCRVTFSAAPEINEIDHRRTPAMSGSVAA
jgi:hypothetical protein